MEETLSNSRFITFHRQQINPMDDPASTLTFAYGTSKYSKLQQFFTILPFTSCLTPFLSQTKSYTR